MLLASMMIMGSTTVGSNEQDVTVILSVAPTDPEEKDAWARQMLRIQVAMWLPASCAGCHRPYGDVDDFLERSPMAGPGFPGGDEAFIDQACWSGEWDNRVAQMRQEADAGE
jgi:mono/diheme cytochrome c family protein